MSALKNLYKSLRMFLLIRFKYRMKTCGRNFYTGFDSYIKKGTLSVGNDVFIGSRAFFSIDEIFIDDYTMIASNVCIVGGDHRFDVVGTPARFTGREERYGVKIGKDVWVGNGVTILDGAVIGEGSIIAAGAIVTKNVEPYSVYAGIPAKKLKSRFHTQEDCIEHSKKIGGSFYKTLQNATN